MKDNSITLPNFLLVGAAKSGTTSLYHYLKQHPEIFMSQVSEPKFITSQFLKFPFNGIGDPELNKNIVNSFQDYSKLFWTSESKKAIGEDSADNLYYYDSAIKYIKKFSGDPNIIIILRNPTERAFSAYIHLIRDSREYLTFEEALEQEDVRKRNNWEFLWLYKSVGFYYKQVSAYIENFSQVKVYLFDDLEKDALGLLKDIYEFLEVNPFFVPDVSTKYNVSGIPKNKFLYEFLTKQNAIKSMVKPVVRFLLPKRKMAKLSEYIRVKNLAKPDINPVTRKYLKDLFREDILKLQDLINRDLKHWLE